MDAFQRGDGWCPLVWFSVVQACNHLPRAKISEAAFERSVTVSTDSNVKPLIGQRYKMQLQLSRDVLGGQTGIC